MAEPSQVRQRSGEDFRVGRLGGLLNLHSCLRAPVVPTPHPDTDVSLAHPRNRRGRMFALAVALASVVALLPQQAEAAPGKLIASDSDSGSLAWPAVYASFDRPRRLSLTYRITMDPQLPASGEVNVDCSRRRREVERDFPWASSTSFSAPIKLTLKRADYCSVDIDFYYDEDPDFASAQIDLYAKQRKKKHRP